MVALVPPPSKPAAFRNETDTTRVASSGVAPIAATTVWFEVAAAPPASRRVPDDGGVARSEMVPLAGRLSLPAGSRNCTQTVFVPSPGVTNQATLVAYSTQLAPANPDEFDSRTVRFAFP